MTIAFAGAIRHSSRLFMALALLSLHWFVLYEYYISGATPERLSGYTGFIMILVGVLLIMEVRHRQAILEVLQGSPHPIETVSISVRLSLLLLPGVAAASSAAMCQPILDLLRADLLTILGFIVVCRGVYLLFNSKIMMTIVILGTLGYLVLEFAYLYIQLIKDNACSSDTMPRQFQNYFSFAKIIYAPLLSFSISREYFLYEANRPRVG